MADLAIHLYTQWQLKRLDSWIGWGASSISDDVRVAALKTLAKSANINQSCAAFLRNTPEFAAMRLAEADLHAAPVRRRAHRQQAFLRFYDANVALLRKSWRLSSPMGDRLRTSSLSDLNITELLQLRTCLKAGWAEEFVVPLGGSSTVNPSVWVTAARRI